MNCLNLFENIPDVMEGEIFEALIQTGHLKLERIISKGQATLPEEWYDEKIEEWIILLKRSVGLLFERDWNAGPATWGLSPYSESPAPSCRVDGLGRGNDLVGASLPSERQQG